MVLTDRHQEIPALRTYIEQRHGIKDTWQKYLYVYDKAATDYAWWDRQKGDQNYMISVLKENAVATFVESIPFDRKDKINTGIESYSIFQNKKARFLVVEYRDPETGFSHLAHAGCCLIFLMEFQSNEWGTDDRFTGPDDQPFTKHDGRAS